VTGRERRWLSRRLLTGFTDEVQRRAKQRYILRAKEAGLRSRLAFDEWDWTANVTCDQRLLEELRTLRFVDDHHHVVIMGPVGVGETMQVHARGHLAVLSDLRVICLTSDELSHRLRASRLDDTHEQEESYRRRQKPLMATK